jgi:hypothetical protein
MERLDCSLTSLTGLLANSAQAKLMGVHEQGKAA